MTQFLPRMTVTALLVAVLSACFAAVAAASPPEATTDPATRISGTTVTLNGTIDSGGSDVVYGFYYGNKGPNYENTGEYGEQTETKELEAGSSPVSVSETITGLDPETTYHFRLVVLNPNSGEGSLGGDVSFSTSAAYAPRLEADEMPTSVLVTRNNLKDPAFWLGGSPIYCGGGAGWLAPSLSEPTSSFAVFAAYGSCSLGGTPATVTMNTCRYTYSVDSGAYPTFDGSLAITCGKKGDAIAIAIPSLSCTLRIPAQEPNSSVTYSNEGQGVESVVQTLADVSGLTVEKQNPNNNFFCSLIGTTGKFTHDSTMSAPTAGDPVGLYVIGDVIE